MDAYREVLRIRPIINPNDGFFKVLQGYQQEVTGIKLSDKEINQEIFEYSAL